MRSDLSPFTFEPKPDYFWTNKDGYRIPRTRDELTFSEYSIYDGEYVANMRDGRGINLEWNTDDSFSYYEGYWVKGIRTGLGRTIWPEHTAKDLGGWIHEGQYLNNERNGLGKINYLNGDKY